MRMKIDDDMMTMIARVVLSLSAGKNQFSTPDLCFGALYAHELT